VSRTTDSASTPSVPSRARLAASLRARRPEIEQATLSRVNAVPDSAEIEDPEYAPGLREAVGAALDYGIAELEALAPEPAPIPDRLLAQARRAARAGAGLDTVLRRYLAGYTLFGEFVMQEAETDGLLEVGEIRRLSRIQAALLDRLVVAATEEYRREADKPPRSAERRRAAQVERLLAGELLDIGELRYELDAWHIGAVASGPEAATSLRELATATDRSLLMVRSGEATVWAWLGGSRRVAAAEALRRATATGRLAETLLALGEPGRGVDGWRRTHRQAKVAMTVLRRGPDRLACYADVALLASVFGDDLLASSLRDLYLAPLAEEHDGGAVLRRTLRAYLAAECNASSAAAALGVNRHTVSNRLHAIEERLGRPLGSCVAEVDAALRLEELGPSLPVPASSSRD